MPRPTGTNSENDLKYAPLAQLDRASASDAEGQRFESSRARHTCHPWRDVVVLLNPGRAIGGAARQGRVIWVRIFGAPARPPNPSSPQRADIVTKLLRCFNASMRLAAQKLHSQTNPVVLDRLTFNGICLHSQCTRENHEGITLKAMPNANRPTSRAVSQDK